MNTPQTKTYTLFSELSDIMITSNLVHQWDLDIAPALREFALSTGADFDMCCDFVTDNYDVKLNDFIFDQIYDICQECAV